MPNLVVQDWYTGQGSKFPWIHLMGLQLTLTRWREWKEEAERVPLRSCFVVFFSRKDWKSFRSCFAFETVSGGVKGAGYSAGNSREKSPDLWEVLNSTVHPVRTSAGGMIPWHRESAMPAPCTTPCGQCWVTTADVHSWCGALLDTT